MSVPAEKPPAPPWVLMLAAASILSITMGIRQSMGLFVLPIVASTGVSLVSVSFALAIGQFIWGAAQPVFGAIADQFGARRVMVVGALLLAAGAMLARSSSSPLGLIATLGVLIAAGTAAGSFAILIGVTARSLPSAKRSFAAGLINAGGSVGQLIFAPFAQFLIGSAGWGIGMFAIAISALLTIPLAWLFRGDGAEQVAHPDEQSSIVASGFAGPVSLREHCVLRRTTAAIGFCTPASSLADFTLHSW